MNASLLSSLDPMLAGAWHQRRNTGSLWSLVVVVGLLLVGPAILYALLAFAHLKAVAAPLEHEDADMLRLAGIVLAGALSTIVLGGFALVVYNLLDQNRPVLARLVPRHAGRLRMALVLAWGVSVAIVTALFNDRFGHPLAWMAGTGALLAYVAASIRWPALWALLAVAPLLARPDPSGPLAVARQMWDDQPAGMAWTVMAASVVLLVALIQAGGRRHIANDEARRRRIQRFRMRARGGEPMVTDQRGAYARWMTRPYYVVLERVLARPGRAGFGRVMLGLGPGLHWTSNAATIVFTALWSLAAYAVIALLGPYIALVHDFGPFVFFGLTTGLAPGLIAAALQVHARLHQTRREQALLVLLPGFPRGAALSRRLAWQMTGQFAMSWVGAFVMVTVLRALAGVPNVHLNHLAPGQLGPWLLIAAVPTFAFQWRPWARLGAPTSLTTLLPLMVIFGLVGLLSWAGPQRLVLVSSIAIGLALAWSALRWWRMGREPTALPIGRLA